MPETNNIPVKILVIDDEPNIRLMIRLALEFSGYQIFEANNGPEGLAAFAADPTIALVLLDQRMPGMTGAQVHEKLRKLAPHAKVIIITAFGTIDLALESIKTGAVDFLRKPFTADTLRLAVQSALQRKVQTSSGVPADLVLTAFTRTTINGFNFDLIEAKVDDQTHDRLAKFDVAQPTGDAHEVLVKLPPFLMELVKAYADCETMPGEERFWTAMAEEALAEFLWQNAEMPPHQVLAVTDLSEGLQRWLDAILTVEAQTGQSS